MKENKGVDWTWVLIFVWMGASIVGIFYGMFLILVGIGLFIYALTLTKWDKEQDVWWKDRQKVHDWLYNGGPKPTEKEFESAAQWFMRSYHIDYRKEDVYPGGIMPNEVYKYMKTEKELPRRMRAR